jgi:DNA mismatch repair protein MutH
MTTKQTIAEIAQKLVTICGQTHCCPKTSNKGKPGLFLETLLGVANTSDPLDCSDGEIKCFPLKKSGNNYVPKETIAVTMLDTESLKTKSFEESKCYTKLKNTLFIPYYRDEENICFFPSTLINLSTRQDILEVLKKDYNTIRQEYIESETLTSTTGTYLQNRTKGPGHGSTSRAFYLRTKFIKDFIPIHS